MTKKSTKLKVFFFLCLFLIQLNHSYNPSGTLGDEDSNYIQLSSDRNYLPLQNKSTLIASIIADVLISLGEKNNDTIKWKDAINKTISNETVFDYYTGQRGMASIGISFFQLYNQTQNTTYLNIAKKIGNYLQYKSIATSNGAVWPRSDNNPWNWTGQRYGNAGIIPFLIKLSLSEEKTDFFDLASSAADYLINIKKKINSNFAMWLTTGDTGFITTDYYYGTAGIVYSLLEIYKITKNNLYLESALQGGNWLESLIEYTDTDHKSGFIPWAITNTSYFNSLTYTGILSGQAGIGKTFLKLFDTTGDEKWLQNAKVLGSWLIDQNINDTGLYANPGSPYLTNRDENAKNILGLSVGSIGIADFFLDLYHVDNDDLWLFQIIRITNTVISSLDSSKYGKIIPFEINVTNTPEYYTGFYFGLSGAIYYLYKLILYFNYSEHITVLEDLLDSIYKITIEFNGLIPPKTDDDYISTDGESGLASIIIGLTTINLNETMIGKYNLEFINALKNLPEPEINYIRPKNSLDDQTIIGLPILLAIAILTVKNRRKTNRR